MNIAFIDNQNLLMSTKNAPDSWTIDMKRLRVYLLEKYHVDKAYLFMGAFNQEMQRTYTLFQDFGYTLIWRLHSPDVMTSKKGNVDTDVVFYIMKDIIESEGEDRIILISGDGDYCRTVEFLLDKGLLVKILFPSRHNVSSLYKRIPESNKAFLDYKGVRKKIEKR